MAVNGTFSAALVKAQKAQPQTAIARRPSEMPSAALTRPVLVTAAASSIIVETITMTTVTERCIVGGITDNRINNITALQTQGLGGSSSSLSAETTDVHEEEAPALPPKESHARALQNADQQLPAPDPSSLAGILKGGKLWKTETVSCVGGMIFCH